MAKKYQNKTFKKKKHHDLGNNKHMVEIYPYQPINSKSRLRGVLKPSLVFNQPRSHRLGYEVNDMMRRFEWIITVNLSN